MNVHGNDYEVFEIEVVNFETRRLLSLSNRTTRAEALRIFDLWENEQRNVGIFYWSGTGACLVLPI